MLGPIFHYGDTWQLVSNTGTTIVTFLMVFLIQNTQNRDSAAVRCGASEARRDHSRHQGAHDAMLDLEELTEQELDIIRRLYLDVAREARLERRKATMIPAVCASWRGSSAFQLRPSRW